jgi:hypothetical protein
MQFIQSLSGGFYLVQLESCWNDCSAVQALRDTLSVDQKKFVAFKTHDELFLNMSEPNCAIGIVDPKQALVGTAFLLEASSHILFEGLNDRQIYQDMPEDTGASAIIATVIVAAEASGRGFMRQMLATLQKEALKKQYMSIMARVIRGNEPSHTNFKKSGFEVIGSAIKHADGLTRDFFYKDLTPYRRPNMALLSSLDQTKEFV